MKCIVLAALVLLGISINAYAQISATPIPQDLGNRKCIDYSKVVIKYTFKFKNYTSQAKQYEDERVVQVGSNVVKDYSEIIFHYDSLSTEDTKKGHLTSHNNPYDTYPCEFFYFYKEKKRTEKYRLMLAAGTLCYQSKVIDMVWDFSSGDSENLLGYKCNKATTTYSGRKYTAWYTTDVPVHYGPYKFSGLPGMIVKIEESTGMYSWELSSVKTKREEIFMDTYESEQKCDEETARKTIARMMKNPIAFLSNQGTKMFVKQSNGKFAPPSKEGREYPYEPIEL